MEAPFDLTGRVAIITGAAGGIGLGTAAVLARAGAHVVLTDIQGELVQQRAAELAEAGLSCSSSALDVTSKASVDALVTTVADHFGRLDIMVNNAAVIDDTSSMTVTDEVLDFVHAVNFKGVVFGSQAAARVMSDARSGSIINVTSSVTDVATNGLAAYSTSKAAAAQFSRNLSIELASRGVRVNVLSPGWTDTPMNERHVLNPDGTVDPDRKAAYVAMHAEAAPLGYVGEASDQAYAILYLASDASRYVTGTVFRVNGGSTTPW